MLERRGFLRGLASLPLIGGSIAVLGQPTAPAVAPSTQLLDHYVAFLAHEHRAALSERFPDVRSRDLPMMWMPDEVCARSLCRYTKASDRAAVILSAAGLPVFGVRA